ncbi:MAG TPA: STAS domain-containing protein [Thermoguttaceae bacterium]|nr:STAS domain-containing protein [Thermoguttaceae bacterium]
MFERVTQGAVDVIRGDAPLNAEHAEEVSLLLAGCLSSGRPYVVLDFDKVPLIDSAGLELVLDFQEKLQQLGGALKLASVNSLPSDILSATGIREGFEIFPEALSAVGSFVR